MADFDNFESANPTEEDPAAEFLAREQTELAGLEDDNFGDDSSAQQAGDGFDAFGGQATEPAAQEDEEEDGDDVDDEFGSDPFGGAGGGFDMIGGGDSLGDGLVDAGSSVPSGGLLDMDATPQTEEPAPVSDVLGSGMGGGFDMMGGGDSQDSGLLDMGSSEPSGGLLDMDAAPPPEPPAPVTNGPSDAYAAISQVDTQRAEPEKIKLWREEQKARLEKKDAEEEEKKREWQDVARKELEDWYKHHAEQLEKAKENNRAAEAAFIKERDESIPGAQWEKICRLCEFNPKNMKSTKDVTRMRSMLLQLKQTPLVR